VGLAAAPRPRRLRGIAVARAFRYKHSGNLATIGKCSAVIDLSWLWIYTTGNRNSCLITQGENKSPALREEEALQE
jgi:NADH dehydrogenase